MFNKQQTQTKESLQVKFRQFIQCFKTSLTLPEYNYLQDSCLGILKGHTVINNRIAQKLFEPITVKKTCERFTRHLNKEDLGKKMQSVMISKQSRGFDLETGIIVDESDIIKSKAKKMEGLQTTRDGSTGKHDQLGYALLNIIAYQDRGQGYEIKPISSDLIARDLELDSVSQILEDRLVEITLASGNKGVYLFDRGYDDRNLCGFLHQNGLNYIIRSTGARNLIVNGEEQNFIEVAKSVKLDMTISLKGSGQYISCGIKRVKLRLNPHPIKNPDTIDTWLIVSRFSPNKDGKEGYFYFLCDFPGQPHLSSNAIVKKAIRMYRIRWKIEEVHRHLKQEYGWEKIQLSSYIRLKNMNQVLLVAMGYLYSLKKYAYRLITVFPSIMKYSNKKWQQIYDFVYYKLSALIEVCLSSVTRYNICPYAGNWLLKEQLEIPCIKNGGM